MFDKVYSIYSYRKEKPLDPAYRPEDAIQSIHILNPAANKLAVIFPGWHTHHFPINVLNRRLVRRGWAVLCFDFHDQILEPDDETVIESFRYIKKKASREIEQLIGKKPYRQVRFVSLSLGGVPMALVADSVRHFTGVTCVVGGDNLAVDMWHGMRTEHYRRQFEKMHIGISRLRKDWDSLAPENHLRNFSGKQVKLIISLHDNFVGTKYQRRLVQQLLEAGADVKLKKRRTGHLLTILRYCFLDSPL